MQIRTGYQVSTPTGTTGHIVSSRTDDDGTTAYAVRTISGTTTWHPQADLTICHLETAAASTARSTKHTRDAHDSWERSDTDGALSQWASGIMAAVHRMQAEIDLCGGRAAFPALFDLEGNMIAAKRIRCRDNYGHGYVYRWGFLASDDPSSAVVRWVSDSEARNPKTRKANNEKKGFRVGHVLALAKADTCGGSVTSVSAYAKRLDGGFSRQVVVLDTGDDISTYPTW